MSKNIVIFSDGTGQEGGEGNNTNIYKLFNMIEDRTQKQVAFYDPGLGTGWRKISGNVGGMGMSRNIQQCYRFIFDHFEAGDKIFLFGFSRGAATVRSLSSFIHYFGILPRSRPELIKKAYKIYKISDNNKRKDKADEFINKHHNIWTKINFLGCYDTVAALGLPLKTAGVILNSIPGLRHKFHNFSLSESVEFAYHALAVDDERNTFHPVLWNSEVREYQKVKQVWFSGMHTDVGGGYEEETLSNIPLVWMTGNAVNHGLLLYPHHKVEIAEDTDGFMHNSRGTWTTKLFRQKVRAWDAGRSDKPVVHQSVLSRTKNHLNQDNPPYRPWILNLDYEEEPWVRYDDHDWSVS
jgi:uncharacterized protein (DUF2235 family)